MKAQGLFHGPDTPEAEYLRRARARPGDGRAQPGRPAPAAGPGRRCRRCTARSSRSSTASRASRRPPPARARRRRHGGGVAVAEAPAASAVATTAGDGQSFELDHGSVVIAAITSLHQHLESVGDAGRRPARPEGACPRPHGQALGQDLARPGLEGGHPLPAGSRAARRPRGAQVQRGRLRLHHLHRQQRPAARAASRRRSTTAAWWPRRCSPATATSKAASTPTCAPTTWRRRRWWWPTRSPAGSTSTCYAEPLGQGSDGQPVFLQDVWPSSQEIADTVAAGAQGGDVPQRIRRRVQGSRAVAEPADSRRRHLRLGRGFDLRAAAALLRRHAARAQAAERPHGRAGAGGARRFGDHRPHLAGRRDQAQEPGRPVPGRARGAPSPTSTRTAPAAATTR